MESNAVEINTTESNAVGDDGDVCEEESRNKEEEVCDFDYPKT